MRHRLGIYWNELNLRSNSDSKRESESRDVRKRLASLNKRSTEVEEDVAAKLCFLY